MIIKSISWQEALPVRHCVLWPNKPESFCKVDGDENANHYGAFIDGKLICVASIYIDGKIARLRKFATLNEFQNKGIGSKVIAYLIDELKTNKIEYFWCDARESAKGFYQRFAMQVQGERFFKSNVAYFKMQICLLE